MKNITTPRTLAACTFETGYARAEMPQRGRIRGWLLAAAIGAGLAAVAFYGSNLV
jgi:hypothetical protein